MEINITFIIQIINFYITYLILSKVILGPVIFVIQEKKADYIKINNHIRQQEALLKQSRLDQEKALIDFQKNLYLSHQKLIAQQEYIHNNNNNRIICINTNSEKDVDYLIKKSKDLIVKRIYDAY